MTCTFLLKKKIFPSKASNRGFPYYIVITSCSSLFLHEIISILPLLHCDYKSFIPFPFSDHIPLVYIVFGLIHGILLIYQYFQHQCLWSLQKQLLGTQRLLFGINTLTESSKQKLFSKKFLELVDAPNVIGILYNKKNHRITTNHNIHSDGRTKTMLEQTLTNQKGQSARLRER